jgi:hypothetical protein
LSRLRPHLSYANVMATIAVFVALGGAGAYAASKLGKNVVKTRNIAPNAVKTADIAKNAVKRTKIAPDAIDDSRLANASVGTNKLLGGSVTTGKLADGAVTEGILSAGVQGKINTYQSGIVRVDSYAGPQGSAPEQTLQTRGPFRIYAKCWNTPGAAYARVFAASSAGGTLVIAGSSEGMHLGTVGDPYLGPNTPENERPIGPQSPNVTTSGTAATVAGSATMVNGASAIQASVMGFLKSASLAADGSNYGAGGARCVFSSTLFSTG